MGKEQICDTFELVTGILVIDVRCQKRKLTEITHIRRVVAYIFQVTKLKTKFKVISVHQ